MKEKIFELPDGRFARGVVPMDPATGDVAATGSGGAVDTSSLAKEATLEAVRDRLPATPHAQALTAAQLNAAGLATGQHQAEQTALLQALLAMPTSIAPAQLDSLVGSSGKAVQSAPLLGEIQAALGALSVLNPGDFVTRLNTSNGQSILALSSSPTTPGQSTLTINTLVGTPGAMEFEFSTIRNRQNIASVCLYADGDAGPDPVPNPINIVSIYQSSADLGAAYNATAGTILTINLETALPGEGAPDRVYLSDWVHVTGLVDTRLNYQNLCIKFISADRKTITAGFADEAALTALAVPVITPTLGTAKLSFYNNMAGARDGVAMRLTGAAATSSVLVTLQEGRDAQVSGALLGDHRVAFGSTAPVLANGVNGQLELKATNRFRFELTPQASVFMARAVDTVASWSPTFIRTGVKPRRTAQLRPRLRVYQPPGVSRPVARIASISKAGTTTWTINTIEDHGLVTGNYVTLKGMRDAVNFPALTTQVAVTVTGPRQFTLIGLTGTATSYGGTVALVNGSSDLPGPLAIVPQTAAVDPLTGWLTLVGNTTWSGASIGDYVDLHGMVDANGLPLGLDGAWEVAASVTTSLVLKPIFDVNGVRVSPNVTSLATTNCGGTVIVRTTLRLHDLMIENWTDIRTSIVGQGTIRADLAMPVYVTSGYTYVMQSTAAALGTSGVGAWFVRGGAARTADIASAALTATSTSAAVDASTVTGVAQYTVDVTAVTGTGVRMYPRIQESFDGGVNFVTIYDFLPVAGATDKTNVSPPLPILGTHMRWVRKVVGTTPSITNSCTRTTRALETATNFRQMVDSVVSLLATTASTDYLYAAGCRQGQIVLTLAAATTVPALKVQACDGDPSVATNWYDVPSATVTGLANASVASAIFTLPPCKFLRLVPTTAGAGITADTYTLLLKAWA